MTHTLFRAVRLVLLPVAALLSLWIHPATAQDEENLARAYYENGMDLMRAGSYRQALEDLTIVAESYGSSPYADNALLQMGMHMQETARDAEEALEYFNAIIFRFSATDSAPEAYIRKGQIFLEGGGDGEGLAEAAACFNRVIRFYPESSAVCDALIHSALVLKRTGKQEEALSRLFDLNLLQSDCSAASRGSWEAAMLLLEMDHPLEAMKRLQSIRDLYPETPEAKKALEALSLLHRMEIRGKKDRSTLYLPDPSFSLQFPEKLKNPSAVQVAGDGRIIVTDQGRGAVYIFAKDGKLSKLSRLKDAARITIAADGTILVGCEDGAQIINGGRINFIIPVDHPRGGFVRGYRSGAWAGTTADDDRENKQGKVKDKKNDKGDQAEEEKLKQLEKVSQAAITANGIFIILCRDQKNAEIFLPPTVRTSAVGRFNRIAIENVVHPAVLEVDREGRIFFLSEKTRSVSVYTSTGKKLTTLGGDKKAKMFLRPVDLAVDAAGNLFVLDAKAREVKIYSRNFRPLFSIPLSGGSMGVEMKDPVSISAGPDGALYLLDRDSKSVHRLN